MTDPYPVDDAKVEPHQLYPRTRTIRGLLIQLKNDPTLMDQTGRRLIRNLKKSGRPGNCVWCTYPTRPRQQWHQDCVTAYFVSINTFVEPPRVPGELRSCVDCGQAGGCEVDHEYPLALAREHCFEGRRGWWKAWTVQNLKWRCGKCHETKTKKDVRDIAAAKRRRKDREAGVVPLLNVS